MFYFIRKKGMKLLFFTIFFIILLFFTIQVFKKVHHQFDYEVLYVDSLEKDEKEIIQFCLLDLDNQYHLINLEIVPTEDLFSKIFDLYHQNKNELPLEYTLNCSTVILNRSIEVIEDTIYITIYDEIPFLLNDSSLDYLTSEEELFRTFRAMKLTYSYLGINKMVIKSNQNEYVF